MPRYAIGDKVVATRNERRLEVVNGQRGTITAIDPEHETITIDNSGRAITVDSVYLRDGHLDYVAGPPTALCSRCVTDVELSVRGRCATTVVSTPLLRPGPVRSLFGRSPDQ